jgi:dihydrofolate reductase
MEQLAIVVAMNAERVIGKAGGLPWHIPEDLKHFRQVTTGHSIIMGRKTHDSIGRALPGRQNIVISRRMNAQFVGCEVVDTLEGAIKLARRHGDDEPMVIGGASIYVLALPLCTRIYLTEVNQQVDGDTFFPEIDFSQWHETARRFGDSGVTFKTLERRCT